jgi:hypothetical protein
VSEARDRQLRPLANLAFARRGSLAEYFTNHKSAELVLGIGHDLQTMHR